MRTIEIACKDTRMKKEIKIQQMFGLPLPLQLI